MTDSNLTAPEYYLEMWGNDYANQVQLVDELIERVGINNVRRNLHSQGLILKHDLTVRLAQANLRAVRNVATEAEERSDSLITRSYQVHCPIVRLDRKHLSITPASPADVDSLIRGCYR